MQVGCFGDLAFEVSEKAIKTIQNFTLKGSANYAKHARAGQKELIELTGTEAQQISFDMVISSYLGCDPRSEINKIKSHTENGYSGRMMIGDDYFGKFVIQSYSLKATDFDRKTGVTVCTVSVSLLEDVED